MKLILINNCPVCDVSLKSDLTIKYLKDPFKVVEEDFKYVNCSNCKSWILNPRPTLLEIGKFYEEDFLFDPEKSKSLKKSFIRKLADRIQEYNMISEVSLACKHLEMNSKYLDYSAGNGQILSLIQKRKPNCKYNATEFSKTYRDYLASLKNMEEVNKDLKDFNSDIKFDLISLFGVLEHVQAPRKLILELKNRLENNGKLIITVPNVNSFQRFIFGNNWYSWLAPRHWQMFTINNLKKLLEEFDMIIVDEKHFFLRTCSATLVTSLFPYLDPLKKGGAIKMLAYGVLFYLFIPFELFASIFNRSGFMGVVVKKVN
tara:strand:- start:11 stop:958 length:948 start_codon:yes stop_codon:yes gene_type:complete